MSQTPCRYAPGPLLRCASDLDIDELASEDVRRLTTARVVLADYDVLQHDFPELQRENIILLNPHLRAASVEEQDEAVREIADRWILENAGYISTVQAAQTIFNTKIKTDGRGWIAYRPPMYGRSVVIPTQETGGRTEDGRLRWPGSTGLLDLKGAGVAPDIVPVAGELVNGLEYLGLALSDFLMKKAVDAILQRELPTVWSVPVYAVLDLGFDIIQGYQGIGPAGMHVRRAHRRRIVAAGPSEDMVTLEIESALRRYGVTAAARDLQLHVSTVDGYVTWQRGRGTPFRLKNAEHIGASLALLGDRDRMTLDRRDVQMAREVTWPPAVAQVVDFGALRVESRFEYPVVRSSMAPLVDEVVWPDSPGFIQPDPKLRLPVETWNRYRLNGLGYALAADFRHGTTSPTDIRREIDVCILNLKRRWRGATRPHNRPHRSTGRSVPFASALDTGRAEPPTS